MTIAIATPATTDVEQADADYNSNMAYGVGMCIGGVTKLLALPVAVVLGQIDMVTGHKSGIVLGLLLTGLWIIMLTQLFFYHGQKNKVLRVILIPIVLAFSVLVIYVIISGWSHDFTPQY